MKWANSQLLLHSINYTSIKKSLRDKILNRFSCDCYVSKTRNNYTSRYVAGMVRTTYQKSQFTHFPSIAKVLLLRELIVSTRCVCTNGGYACPLWVIRLYTYTARCIIIVVWTSRPSHLAFVSIYFNDAAERRNNA